MRDKRLKEMFEQELEIPDVVQEKMREVYRQVGADMDKVEKASYRNDISRMGTRYVKAASIALVALMVTTTVHAATGGGFGKLSGLFRGDVSQIQSSSVTPEVSSEKSTFKNLKVSVERVFGTEELSYVVLRVKRTDGKTFDKNMDYRFSQVGMKGESDGDWAGGAEGESAADSNNLISQADTKEEKDTNEKEDAKECCSAVSIMIGGGEKPKVESVENNYTDTGIMIENNGTDEIHLAVVCGYEQVMDGVSRYHKGEKCRLRLSGLCGDVDGEEKTRIDGTAETEFVMDYGDCQKKVCEPGKKIRLPKLNSETKYLSAGKLDRVTVTPYFIRYERTMTEKQFDNKTWDQVYVEMEDGTRIGYPTLNSWLEQENGRGGYGIGTDGKHNDYLMFVDLIDVEHVKAVYFGNTRIDM